MLTKDDLKAIVDTISPLIDARARTTETLIKGEINGLNKRTDEAEQRMSKRIAEVKEELRAEILAARAEAKGDILSIGAKLVKKTNSQERRIDELEKEAGIPHPHKN